jgi:multicomponent Na+:H+ antiporter subunit D
VLTAALMISSLLNIAYLIPIPIQAFMAPRAGKASDEDDGDHGRSQGIHEAPMMCVVPLCITAIGTVVLFFFAPSIYQFLLPITE